MIDTVMTYRHCNVVLYSSMHALHCSILMHAVL